MGVEIERKFLVVSEEWRGQGECLRFEQGYLSRSPERSVRVRIEGDRAKLNIKSGKSLLRRLEFEYDLPLEDARHLLREVCEKPLLQKERTVLEYAGKVWEVDEFFGENQGLIVAEVELQDENERVDLPPWIGEEVSHDPRYLNISLIDRPFQNWTDRD
ncbi:MAG: CYTH domain-containing protein [bacterium]